MHRLFNYLIEFGLLSPYDNDYDYVFSPDDARIKNIIHYFRVNSIPSIFQQTEN